jgi:hypothetical protein
MSTTHNTCESPHLQSSSLIVHESVIYYARDTNQGPRTWKDIDVYIAPLVDDFILLWKEQVKVYDACVKTSFTWRCMLFITRVNDYPNYENDSARL